MLRREGRIREGRKQVDSTMLKRSNWGRAKMRPTLVLLLAGIMGSCASITDTGLRAPRQQVGKWALGVGVNHTYGLWSPTWVHGDGSDEEPFDTTWTSVMLQPVAIAFDDTFLVVRNKRGKYLITVKTPDGRQLWKSAHSEKRYLALRTELAIPDSLVLRPIP